MNLVHWFFFLGTAGISLIFTLYDLWVRRKYSSPHDATVVTGCDTARAVLDHMGVAHISVTPVEPPHEIEDYLFSDGFFLEKKIYNGRDALALALASRQAFLKGQLSNIAFWAHLKRKMAIAIRFAAILGWVCLLVGLAIPPLHFLIHFGLGAFVVVMVFAIFDLPFEIEVGEKTSKIVKMANLLTPNEYVRFKKVNQAVSFSNLTCLIRAPFCACGCFFKRK